MSIDFVPDLDEMHIDGAWRPGRQVRALRCAARPAVAWVTHRGAFEAPGLNWASLSSRADSIGMQPFLLTGPDGGPARPWDDGELGEPEDITAIDAMDAAHVLHELWNRKNGARQEPGSGRDTASREPTAPTGPRYSGLASPLAQELDPDLIWLALHQYGSGTRIGLVPVDRPADILPRTGWQGAGGHCTASALAAVLRSWEDRFGARLLEVGPDTIRVLVARPPQSLDQALGIAAEHLVLSDASQGRSQLREIAPALVDNPFWDLRWHT
jgi:hypothetical protein